MKIEHATPPNYPEILQAFPEVKDKPYFYAYGDTIYNPEGVTVFPDAMIHESVHEQQQKELGPDSWWKKYLSDPFFRLDQEVEAYATQYNFVKANYKTKLCDFFLYNISKDLSGPMYGNMIGLHEANTKIRLVAKLLSTKEQTHA